MSLLTLIQNACLTIGSINAPTSASSSSDPQIKQMVALANREGQDLASRYQWQVLHNEATFTTLAAELQGTISALTGAGLDYILNDVMWNRDLRRPVFGPLAAYQWQQLEAQRITGPWNQYRIRGDELLFIPAPTAGENIYFEWISKNWCTGVGGDAPQWAADADTGLLDENVMLLGLIWRWKAAKGLEYAEDKATYENRVVDLQARDGTKPRLNLNGVNTGYPVGVFVPSGSWNV